MVDARFLHEEGDNEDYGPPSPETIEALKEHGIELPTWKPVIPARAVVPASLRDDAEAFAFAAFDNGHYPNPVGHSFDGCSTCRAANAADDLVHHLDAGAKEETVETRPLPTHVYA